jgi:hypothetical protein
MVGKDRPGRNNPVEINAPGERKPLCNSKKMLLANYPENGSKNIPGLYG